MREPEHADAGTSCVATEGFPKGWQCRKMLIASQSDKLAAPAIHDASTCSQRGRVVIRFAVHGGTMMPWKDPQKKIEDRNGSKQEPLNCLHPVLLPALQTACAAPGRTLMENLFRHF
jgi:hypothetical protein